MKIDIFTGNGLMEREVSDHVSSERADHGPYLVTLVTRVVEQIQMNPDYEHADKNCACGHSYDRHFDSYENWYPIGCKYCNCFTFKLPR